ncbi:MAG TPA: NmrA family NAD(P)-binding protein [Steroidobacteraceae bacterium]|jgi:NADH dehydrogenase
MNDHIVTVFGGTGFLGRRVVRHLRTGGFFVRIASRHPERGEPLFDHNDPLLQSVEVDLRDEQSIADALDGAYGAINAVSLYVEHGQ